ncbi:MAG TPA: nucleotidyltransferase domain-containing protein [Candidatus Kapabacteria bacterium]|nr:nucleotidyltransferase domain-containing protein [Candidatus Kapabacteria bacterium]
MTIPFESIRHYATQIAERFHPSRIVLFGSQVWGSPRPDSDVDLLVVMPFDGKGMRQSVRICHEFHPPFPLDLIVRKPEEVATCVDRRDFFLQDVLNRGIVLYDQRNQ